MRGAPPWPATLRLYEAGMGLLAPFAGAILDRRMLRGKEDPARRGERLGWAGLPRPAGPLAWLHGASVGETVSLLPLVERLAAKGVTPLVTSGTVNSARVMGARLPAGALHQFVPLDAPRFLARFLDHWRPGLALIAESELWPGIVAALARRGVPLVIANGRMSARSARRWARLPRTAGALMARVELCLAQSEADAARFEALGARDARCVGNLKFDAPAPPADPAALAAVTRALDDRPVLLAASTHPGEEEGVLEAHARLRNQVPGLLTILLPRHPERGAAVAALATGLGVVARRSAGALPDGACEVYVADTIGETGLFYRAAGLVFVGGSLVPHGGQNPIEPGRLGRAVLHGPHVRNFAEVYAALDVAGGAAEVADAAALAEVGGALLADPGRLAAMGEAARVHLEGQGGATTRTMAAIKPILAMMTARG